MTIRHTLWEYYAEKNEAREARHALAAKSWQIAGEIFGGQLCTTKCVDEVAPRFIDLMDAQWRFCEAGDVILYTSADIGFSEHVCDEILKAVRRFGSCHAKRKEVGPLTELPTQEQIEKAPTYCGLDFCAFTKEWWTLHRMFYPAQARVGFYGWDSIARNLIRRTGGVEIQNVAWSIEQPPEQNTWNKDFDTIYKHPINVANRRALYDFLWRYGGSSEDHLFSDEELRELWR